jgi:hypothetical protein
VVTVDEDVFEQAGEPIAHDTTWTWDDYHETSRRISDKLDGISGTE